MTVDHTLLGTAFQYHFKTRYDKYEDQYNRWFMFKLLTLCAMLMAACWYYDRMNCVMPDAQSSNPDDESDRDTDFVSQACWIQGLYVYKELRSKVDRNAYYGIPQDVAHDGFVMDGDTQMLCRTKNKDNTVNEWCKPMTKHFFLQYQWLPIFMAALSIIYYIPYIFFHSANQHLIQLHNAVNTGKCSKKIIDAFFIFNTKTKILAKKTIFLNFFVKILYMLTNVIAFTATDSILDGRFWSYGMKWIHWSKLDNYLQDDYMGKRQFPKPGHDLLPPFGYCELYEHAQDVRESFVNKHKILCEASQNVLYQYVFITLWFAFIFGLFVSIIGFLRLIMHYVWLAKSKKSFKAKDLLTTIYFNECLRLIKSNDVILYIEILEKISGHHGGNDVTQEMLHNQAPSQKARTYSAEYNDM